MRKPWRTVTNGYVEFQAAAIGSNRCNLTFKAEDTDDASAFSSTAYDVTFGEHEEDLVVARKGCEWKVVLASWIKSQCGVRNQWLSDQLHTGSPTYVSRLVCEEDKRPYGRRKHWRQLHIAKGRPLLDPYSCVTESENSAAACTILPSIMVKTEDKVRISSSGTER